MDEIINVVFTSNDIIFKEGEVIIRKIEMNPSEEVLKELGINSHDEYLEYLATVIDELYE